MRSITGIMGILLILSVIVMVSGCTSTPGNSTYDSGNFTFQYPGNWTVNNESVGPQVSGQTTTTIAFVSPQSGNYGNLSISIDIFNPGMASSAKAFVNSIFSPPLTNKSTITIANTTGYTFDQFNQDTNIKTKSVVFDKNGKTYEIDLDSGPNNYDYGLTVWNMIVQSFSFK